MSTRVIDDINTALFIIKTRHWENIPRVLHEGWRYAFHDLDTAIKNVPYITPHHIYTVIRRARWYIRTVIQFGQLDSSEFPIDSYADAPVTRESDPTIYQTHEARMID